MKILVIWVISAAAFVLAASESTENHTGLATSMMFRAADIASADDRVQTMPGAADIAFDGRVENDQTVHDIQDQDSKASRSERGFEIGQRVQRRDGSSPWGEGIVTSLSPLKVTITADDPNGIEFGSWTWDEVRPIPKDSACSDDTSFEDASGFACTEWQGYDCHAAQEDYGYTKQEQDDLLNKCRKSCESCEEDVKIGSDSDSASDDDESDSASALQPKGSKTMWRRRRRRRRRDDRRRVKEVMSCAGLPCTSAERWDGTEKRYFCYIGDWMNGEDDRRWSSNCQFDHQSCKGVADDDAKKYVRIDKDSAINIIFVPYEYGDLTTFVQHVKMMTKEMQTMMPLNVDEAVFLNYYYVDQRVEEPVDKKELCSWEGDNLFCEGDGYDVINAHVNRYCGDGITKAVIVVHNPVPIRACQDVICPDENSGSALPPKRAGIVVGGGWKGGRVAAHELGHILFGFGDQYNENNYERSSCAFNCVSDKEECEQEAGGQCVLGCSSKEISTQASPQPSAFYTQINLMTNHDYEFGRLLERATCCKWYYQGVAHLPEYCEDVGLREEEDVSGNVQQFCEEEVKPDATKNCKGQSSNYMDPSNHMEASSLLSQHVTHRFGKGLGKQFRKGFRKTKDVAKNIAKGVKKPGKYGKYLSKGAGAVGSGVAYAGKTAGRGMVTAAGAIGNRVGFKNKLNKKYGLRSMRKGLTPQETKERNVARASDEIGESYEMFDKPDACFINFNEFPLSPTCSYVDEEEKKQLIADGLYSDRESKGDFRKPLCKCDERDSLCLRNVTLEVHDAATKKLYRTVTFFNKLERELAGDKDFGEDLCTSSDSARLVMKEGDVVKLTHYGHSNARKVIVDCMPRRSSR